uniref:UBC core domain-containing protein n=1 Tax=Neobodo designis TaxID=312471 RepID=A0A7S1LQ15_NEODS|mmetsp:Transcript_26351/g.81428  ORF Transcript_26351/g.81428 Transcript_26351/m.81428 type:complete len:264 (+) Transcript_26351:311-1102(+)
MSAKAVKRLSSELKEMVKSPPPLADARPDEHNILRWVFVLEGAPDTPYEGGEYVGELLFPDQYPFKPPSIKMITPSGRFKTHTRLCFSMSDFHPEEWSPMWGVRQILIGLNSFMSEDATTHGSINASAATRRELAGKSHAFNVAHREYETLFPERYAATLQRIASAEEAAEIAAAKQRRAAASSGSSGDASPSLTGDGSGAVLGRSGFLSTWRGAALIVGAASVIIAMFALSGSGDGPATAASSSAGGWNAPPLNTGASAVGA